ncbi:predicted protein [Verticillium alfalfae VaMs.102]|uniref:Predicted protein n=1 Tax=Verticillium alfalfae (strain VaMs.102 / ATCC MYA-4576 / FGSC 10136) TaxID=526221 RepID=C9SEY8_VERA1|nr:predicted protein [Verticillium alfalfae VaMs.102]EEY17774.1 predicted protein [Verticillium alfalfae VaMs.102]
MNENRLQRSDNLRSLSESWMRDGQSQLVKECFEPEPKLTESFEASDGQRRMVQGIGEFSGRFPSLPCSNSTGHIFGVGSYHREASSKLGEVVVWNGCPA